jgi:hypothetical protein
MWINSEKKQREVLKALTIRSAERNVEEIETKSEEREKSNRRRASNIRKINEYECSIIFVICIE